MKQKLTYFRRTRTFVLSLLLLSCMAAQGQQQPSRMVKGLVKMPGPESRLLELPYWSAARHRGTTTGISGEYAVSVPSGSTELEFSFLGYVCQNSENRYGSYSRCNDGGGGHRFCRRSLSWDMAYRKGEPDRFGICKGKKMQKRVNILFTGI